MNLLNNHEKSEITQAPPLSSASGEMNAAGTTPSSPKAGQNLEPEFSLTGTVLNDYS